METSLMVTDYPEPPESKEKMYKFEFEASIKGYGYVYAENEDEAKELINSNDYGDIVDTWDMEIQEITKIEEE